MIMVVVKPILKEKARFNWWKLISWLVETIFFYFLRQQSTAASGN